MKTLNKRERDRLNTRAAILDATEALLRDDGYAAVTARRVAERAGLKSQLVHYHFSSMDELFHEAFRRLEKGFYTRHLEAAARPNPIKGIWDVSNSREGLDIVSEFESAAKYRKILEDDLIEIWSRFRALHSTMIAKYFQDKHIDPGDFTAPVIAFLISAVGQALANEASHGFTEGHAEIIEFMEKMIARLTPPETGSS